MPGLKLADGVSFTDGKTSGTLCEKASEKVFTLNPSGCIVIREIMLGHRNSPDEVVKGLKNLYEDPDGKIEYDTKQFIDNLKSAGLLEFKP